MIEIHIQIQTEADGVTRARIKSPESGGVTPGEAQLASLYKSVLNDQAPKVFACGACEPPKMEHGDTCLVKGCGETKALWCPVLKIWPKGSGGKGKPFIVEPSTQYCARHKDVVAAADLANMGDDLAGIGAKLSAFCRSQGLALPDMATAKIEWSPLIKDL